jgi:hypothetical protein
MAPTTRELRIICLVYVMGVSNKWTPSPLSSFFYDAGKRENLTSIASSNKKIEDKTGGYVTFLRVIFFVYASGIPPFAIRFRVANAPGAA